MGLFSSETEEEKTRKKVIKAIRYSDIDDKWKNYFIDYFDDVFDNVKKNWFITLDNLIEVMMDVIEQGENDSYLELDEEFQKYIEAFNTLLPLGEKTENAELLIRMFLDNFLGEKGIIRRDIFNPTFYALFNNPYDYLEIINIIRKEADYSNNDVYIFDFAAKVSPYCANREVFKSEVINYINGLQYDYGDIDLYTENKLKEAKKRCGVYPVDEHTLAIIAAEAEKAQALIEKLQNMQDKVTTYYDNVQAATKSGKKELRNAVVSGRKELSDFSVSGIAKMQETINDEVKTTREMLDSYLLTLEDQLKKSSDQVFNAILEKSAKRVREIKLAAESLSTTTTSELLRIKSATEDSVSKLKDYVENEPQLQSLLKGASEGDKIREVLLSLNPVGEQQPQAVVASSAPGILIPGNDRIVVPANSQVIIPDSGIKSKILPAFDRSIPYKQRYNKIIDKKKRREDKGEIFHSVTDEVIGCILENDWPYLWGPSGCGKSYTIRQIAELVGLDLIDNGKITDKYSLMAYNDPQGKFRATQAFVAVVYGKLLLLDEFDNGNTDTQVLLNELYSASLDVLEKPNKPRYVTFAEDMTVPVSPNFRMVSAGNTSGEGENQIFSSRGKSDESVQERMTPIFVNYDNRIEQRIFGEFTEWYDFFINFRKACDAYAISEGLDTAPGIGTTRDASAIVRYIIDESKSLDEVIRQKFVQTKSPAYLKFLMNEMKRYYSFDRVSDANYNGTLKNVTSKTLAKKFICKCNEVAGNKRV